MPRGDFPASGNVPRAVGKLSSSWNRSPRRGEAFPPLETFLAPRGTIFSYLFILFLERGFYGFPVKSIL